MWNLILMLIVCILGGKTYLDILTSESKQITVPVTVWNLKIANISLNVITWLH